jgi:adenylyltransferase/sulfurtransferase
MNYEWLCASIPTSFEIDSDRFDELLETGGIDIIDVRELYETPEVNEFDHQRVPMQQVETFARNLKSDTIVVFCQTGKRSKQAATLLSGIFGSAKKVYSLSGGIVNWKNQHMA